MDEMLPLESPFHKDHRSLLSLSLRLWMCCSRLVPRCWMVRMRGLRPSAPPLLSHSCRSADRDLRSRLSRQPDCSTLTARAGNLSEEMKQLSSSSYVLCYEPCVNSITLMKISFQICKTLRTISIAHWQMQQQQSYFLVKVLTHQCPPLI